MRVVHAVRSVRFWGVERYIAYVAPLLAEAGCQVTVIGGHQGLMASAVGPGVEVEPAETTRQAAASLLRHRLADVVHVHMTAAEAAAAAIRPLLHGRVVSTRHFASRRGAHWWSRVARPVIARATDCQMATSQFVAERIDGSADVLHPGVPDAPAS